MLPPNATQADNSPWRMTVVGWKSISAPVVKALVDFQLRSGMIVRECGYCESGGNRWVNPTQRIVKEGLSEPEYVNLIEFVADELKMRFQHEALLAVDQYQEDVKHGF